MNKVALTVALIVVSVGLAGCFVGKAPVPVVAPVGGGALITKG